MWGREMIETEIKKYTKVILTLDKEEAEWLHAFMQNPLSKEETMNDVEMRKKFFHATQDIDS